jgi:DNA protecting protein DprA
LEKLRLSTIQQACAGQACQRHVDARCTTGALIMRKLFYMALESYESRYTLQLTEWNRRVFERRGLDVVYVPGETLDNSGAISVGQVLDAHGRSYFAMSQMMNLVKMMRNGEVTSDDVVYFEDMFSPGIESLPYIMDQVPVNLQPQIYVRCLAQAIDPDDFVHVWGMAGWMSTYERMVNQIPNVRVLATNEEMVAHMRIAGWSAPIYNISGLAFGIDAAAHLFCLKNDLRTVGVIAHGLGSIYPADHRELADKISEQGAILSEYPWSVRAEKEFFPMRNRIIAGLSDGVLVVETAERGGSMITAQLANDYHKEVMALPGRKSDKWSSVCLKMIKNQ